MARFKDVPWEVGAKFTPAPNISPEDREKARRRQQKDYEGFMKQRKETSALAKELMQRKKLGESNMAGHDFLTKAIDQLINTNDSVLEVQESNNLISELTSLTEEDIVVLEAMITEAFNTAELAQKIASIIRWIMSTGVLKQLQKEEVDINDVLVEAVLALNEGRGRPKGSKNKPKGAAMSTPAAPAKKGDDEEEENDEGPAYRSASLGDSGGKKRGRGRPTGAVENAHIQDQLKSAVDLGGNKVTFRDGKSHHVKQEHAEAVLRHLHGLKPADRAETAARAFDSHSSFQDVLKAAQSKTR